MYAGLLCAELPMAARKADACFFRSRKAHHGPPDDTFGSSQFSFDSIARAVPFQRVRWIRIFRYTNGAAPINVAMTRPRVFEWNPDAVPCVLLWAELITPDVA